MTETAVKNRIMSLVVTDEKKQHPPEVAEIRGATQLDLYKRDALKILKDLSSAVENDQVIGVAIVTMGPDMEASASVFTSACADNFTSMLGGLSILKSRIIDECLE